jgi:hypothetical protein
MEAMYLLVKWRMRFAINLFLLLLNPVVKISVIHLEPRMMIEKIVVIVAMPVL